MTATTPMQSYRVYDNATIVTATQAIEDADTIAVHEARVVASVEGDSTYSFPHGAVRHIQIEVSESEVNGRPALVTFDDARGTVRSEHVVVLDDGWVRVAEPRYGSDGVKLTDSPPEAHHAVEWKI